LGFLDRWNAVNIRNFDVFFRSFEFYHFLPGMRMYCIYIDSVCDILAPLHFKISAESGTNVRLSQEEKKD